jgi:hypothetical protein
MPNLDEFLNNSNKELNQEQSNLEHLDGVRPCAKCDLNVEGGFWDNEKLLLSWKCNNGHENSIQVG